MDTSSLTLAGLILGEAVLSNSVICRVMRRREVSDAAAPATSSGCSVEGCDGAPKRSQPRSRVAEALPNLDLAAGRRVKLCRDHYREYRRASRETRRLDRMGG